MSYANSADLEARWGRDQLEIVAGIPPVDEDDPMTLDEAKMAVALADASAEADALLNGRYVLEGQTQGLPLLVRAVCDLAMWALCSSTTVSDFIRERREAAVALLKRIGEGKADLGVGATIGQAQGQPVPGQVGAEAPMAGRADFAGWRL